MTPEDFKEIATPLIALLAVILSGVSLFLSSRSQAKALQSNNESQKRTLETNTAVARANREADFRKQWINELRHELSDFMLLHYDLDARFRSAKFDKKSFPRDDQDEDAQYKAETSYHRVILSLDPMSPSHRLLIDAIKRMRDDKDKDLWIEKRNEIVKIAQQLLSQSWKDIHGEMTVMGA